MSTKLSHPSRPVIATRLITITFFTALLGLQTVFTAWSLFTVRGRTPLMVGACVELWGGCDWAPSGDWFNLHLVRARRGVGFGQVDSLSAMEKAGIRSGDLLVRVDGRETFEHPGAYFELLIRGRPGQAVPLVWLRDGVEHTGTLILPEGRLGRTGTARSGWIFQPFFSAAVETWLENGPLLLFYFLLFILGGLIGFLRIRDPVAFLFAACMLALGVMALLWNLPLMASWPFFVLALVTIGQSLSLLCLALVIIPLFAVFPSQSRFGKRMLRLRLPLACIYALWGVGLAAYDLVSLYPEMPRWSWPWMTKIIEWGADLPFSVLVVIIGSLLIAQRIDARKAPSRRFRTVQWGLALMVVCGLVWFAINLLPLPADSIVAYAVMRYAAVLALLLLPVAFAMVAYGVIAQRMFSLRFAVRRGIQHLLLSRGVLVGEFVLLFFILLQILRSAQFDFSESVPAVAALAMTSSALAVIGLGRVNLPLMGAIDRRFFRETYDGRRVLVGLGQQLAGLTEPSAILERAGNAVLVALHPVRVTWFGGVAGDSVHLEWERRQYRSGRQPVTATESKTADTEPGTEDLDRIKGALVEFDSGRPRVEYPPTREEADAPLDLGRPAPFELVMPVRAGDELLGCLALAVKLSEEPYSGEDKDLLQGVVQAVGLALKNASLVEVAKREALMVRDLNIAREVQRRFFPRVLPEMPGWGFAGVCRPALAVGGDYYDIFAVGSNSVALALGDVSGKGLGASLTMANLHAQVRSQLPRLAGDLGTVMSELNEHLVDSLPEEMFVTLFLGVLDTVTGKLRYVNAGHPPGLIVKASTGEVLPLEQHGLIAGAIPGAKYEEGHVNLEAGNAFVVYSDGVTEAAGSGGEMYGEERLEAVLREVRQKAANDILSEVLGSVEVFSSGIEQADDISIIVVQLKDSGRNSAE